MARRTVTYSTSAEDQRDANKHFLITEMPAAQGEAWAIRALLAMSNAGVEVPDEVLEMGMAGIATVGVKALGALKFEIAKPLLDEMFECVQNIPDIRNPKVVRALVDSDIEEIKTRFKLRMEVLSLHVGFSLAAKLQTTVSRSPAAAKVKNK